MNIFHRAKTWPWTSDQGLMIWPVALVSLNEQFVEIGLNWGGSIKQRIRNFVFLANWISIV